MVGQFRVERDKITEHTIFLRSKWAERRLGISFDDAYQEAWLCIMGAQKKSKPPQAEDAYKKWLNTKIKSHLIEVWHAERHHVGFTKGTKAYDPLLFNPVEIREPSRSIDHLVHCKMLVDLLRAAIFPCLYDYHLDLLAYCEENGDYVWWLSDFARERQISKHTVYDRMKVMRKMVHELMTTDVVRLWYVKK